MESRKFKGHFVSRVGAGYGGDGCCVCDVHLSCGGASADERGNLEQCLVSTLVLRCDPLHGELGVRGIRSDRLLDRGIHYDQLYASADWWFPCRRSARLRLGCLINGPRASVIFRFSRVKRTSVARFAISAFHPKRTCHPLVRARSET